jgi:hypothetical protein
MRYFFDYTTKDRSLLDYRGDEFQSSQAAMDFAESIAQLLTNNLAKDWAGWSIEVRNITGKILFSMQIEDRADGERSHNPPPGLLGDAATALVN